MVLLLWCCYCGSVKLNHTTCEETLLEGDNPLISSL